MIFLVVYERNIKKFDIFMFVFIFFLSIFFLRYIKWPTTLSHFFFFFNKTNTKTDVPFSYFQKKKKKSIFLEKLTLRLTILLICSKSQYFLEKQILKLTILSHFHNFFREKKKKKQKRENFKRKTKAKNQPKCLCGKKLFLFSLHFFYIISNKIIFFL